MKKVLVVLALVVLSVGLVESCTPEDTATQDELYEQSTDKDPPSGGDKGGN